MKIPMIVQEELPQNQDFAEDLGITSLFRPTNQPQTRKIMSGLKPNNGRNRAKDPRECLKCSKAGSVKLLDGKMNRMIAQGQAPSTKAACVIYIKDCAKASRCEGSY